MSVNKRDQEINDMLDDMRAEITTLYSKYGDGSGWEESRNITLNEVIAIIDKYKEESGM